MVRCFGRYAEYFGVTTLRTVASFLLSFVLLTAVLTSATPDAGSGACALLTPTDIAKVTGLKVDNGTAGTPVPGILGKCTWTGGVRRVIVTLSDAQHMQATIAATMKSGGTEVQGLGSKAVGIEAAPFTGGGYIVSVLDAKGGFGVSTLGGKEAGDHAIALARIIESRR